MADKNSDYYNDCIDNLKTKCRIQEEILSLEMIQTNYNWPVSDRINELNTMLKDNYEKEHPLADILNKELDTDVEFLLDLVINSWKTHTISYTKEVKTLRVDKQAEILKKLDELREIIDDDTEDSKVTELENELSVIRDELLQEEASIFKNIHLLNDCKITPAFLNLEKRKAGYCNIVRLKIGMEKDEVTPIYTNDPTIIRTTMEKFYTNLYTEQDVKASKDDILNFLKSDNDITPSDILTTRRIPNNIKDEMEVPLSKEELTNALFKDMKPNSAPGIDGFSVLFVREFWDSLVDLVWHTFNSMNLKGSLTSTIKSAIQR